AEVRAEDAGEDVGDLHQRVGVVPGGRRVVGELGGDGQAPVGAGDHPGVEAEGEGDVDPGHPQLGVERVLVVVVGDPGVAAAAEGDVGPRQGLDGEGDRLAILAVDLEEPGVGADDHAVAAVAVAVVDV